MLGPNIGGVYSSGWSLYHVSKTSHYIAFCT